MELPSSAETTDLRRTRTASDGEFVVLSNLSAQSERKPAVPEMRTRSPTKDSPPITMTPVGVTIARKRKQEVGGLSEKKQSEKTKKHQTERSLRCHEKRTISSNEKKIQKAKKKHPVSSFRVLLEGSALYLACLILPTAIGFLLQNPRYWFQTIVSVLSTSPLSMPMTRLPEQQRPLTSIDPDHSSWSSFIYQHSTSYVCPHPDRPIDHSSTLSSVAEWASLSAKTKNYLAWLCPAWLCPEHHAETAKNIPDPHSVFSRDATYSDFLIVLVMSLTLACVRIAVVQQLVPKVRQDSAKLQALMRCKSIHLLSSEYQATLTPRGSIRSEKTVISTTALQQRNCTDRNTNIEQEHQNMQPPPMPELPNLNMHTHPDSALDNNNNDDDNFVLQAQQSVCNEGEDDEDYSYGGGIRIDDSEKEDSEREENIALHAQPLTPRNLAKDEVSLSQAELSDVWLKNFSERMQAVREIDTATEAATPTSFSPSNRLHAAPRYATAVFRLIYTTAASALALYFFRQANFWPWYVGGRGLTSRCWDLSGGLSGIMDSDFDSRNGVLRAYFLWQASYHFHSGAFHVMSLVMLLLQKPNQVHPSTLPPAAKSTGKKFWKVQESMAAYIRSLMQHCLALVLIATAYVFSSLRRLGAIGMFAFDVSSWFLHLLQICINAPEHSPLKSARTVKCIYYWFVIPAFVWGRFFVWPALWYSVAVESSYWLEQFERILVPGSGFILGSLVHVWMMLLTSVTIIFFQRLLNHPHLGRILQQK